MVKNMDDEDYPVPNECYHCKMWQGNEIGCIADVCAGNTSEKGRFNQDDSAYFN
jgi:hypothetical protein